MELANDENAAIAKLLGQLSAGGREADVAHYRMAEVVVQLIDTAYRPLPMNIRRPSFPLEASSMETVRSGVRSVAHKLDAPHVKRALDEGHREIVWAVDFLRFVREVHDRETQNAVRCATVLYGLGTFLRLNPEGDAERIGILRDALERHYGVTEGPGDRAKNMEIAIRATRRYDVLPAAWRELWEKP